MDVLSVIVIVGIGPGGVDAEATSDAVKASTAAVRQRESVFSNFVIFFIVFPSYQSFIPDDVMVSNTFFWQIRKKVMGTAAMIKVTAAAAPASCGTAVRKSAAVRTAEA